MTTLEQDLDDVEALIRGSYDQAGWSDWLDTDMTNTFEPNLRIFREQIFQDQPTMWILFGPQGSGKSTVVRMLLDERGVAKTDCVHCGIDDYVYSSARFKEGLMEIQAHIGYNEFVEMVSNYAKSIEGGGSTDMDIEEILMNHPVRKMFTALYFEIRKVMDSINDRIMDLAIKWKPHIIFEIVGAGSASNMWYHGLIDRCTNQGISLNIVYPYVDHMVVKARYLQRAVKEHYALNIYGPTLVANIMENFKLFSKSATLAFVVNNNLPVYRMDHVPCIFTKRQDPIGSPPAISYTYNKDVKVEEGLTHALSFIAADCETYEKRRRMMCRYNKSC